MNLCDDIWKNVFSFLTPVQQYELSSLCRAFCKAGCPCYVDLQSTNVADPFALALEIFYNFRRKNPTRLFEIRCGDVVVTRRWDYHHGPHHSDVVESMCFGYSTAIGFRGLALTDLVDLPELSHGFHDKQDIDCYGLCITSPGMQAIYDQKGVHTITVNAQHIPQGAFADLPIRQLHFGDDVQYIHDFAFVNCQWLGRLTVSDHVIQIGQHAFAGCFSLISVTVEGGAHLHDEAFSNCEDLTHVIFRTTNVNLGNQVFIDCPNLKEVVLPPCQRPGMRVRASFPPDICFLTDIVSFVHSRCEVALPNGQGSMTRLVWCSLGMSDAKNWGFVAKLNDISRLLQSRQDWNNSVRSFTDHLLAEGVAVMLLQDSVLSILGENLVSMVRPEHRDVAQALVATAKSCTLGQKLYTCMCQGLSLYDSVRWASMIYSFARMLDQHGIKLMEEIEKLLPAFLCVDDFTTFVCADSDEYDEYVEVVSRLFEFFKQDEPPAKRQRVVYA